MDTNLKNIFNTLNTLLGNTELKDVTSESSGFQKLPDGYYLSEVKKAELKTSKQSKEPMVALQLKIVEDGDVVSFDKNNRPLHTVIKGTKNRTQFIYYVLKDSSSVTRFVSDMLKFEGETAGEPLLTKEYFTNSELLEDALEILLGMRIYTHVSTTAASNDYKESTWTNIVSWKAAVDMGFKA